MAWKALLYTVCLFWDKPAYFQQEPAMAAGTCKGHF